MKFINITTTETLSMRSTEMRINIDKIISYFASGKTTKIQYDHNDEKYKVLYAKETVEKFEQRLRDILAMSSTAYQIEPKEGYKRASKESSSQQDLVSGKVELHSRELIEQAKYHYEKNQISKLGLNDKDAYIGGFGDGYYFLKKKLREANEQQQNKNQKGAN